MECFSVELVSPERRKCFDRVRSVAARTGNGEFVVMANHETAVMNLLSGGVLLKDENEKEVVVLVSRAVLSVENNKCVVMADFFVFPEDDKGRFVALREKLNSLETRFCGVIEESRKEDLKYIDVVLKT